MTHRRDVGEAGGLPGSSVNRPVLKSPWAVLVCRFNDKENAPFTIQDYQTMFTAVGVGSSCMVDYFRDVSHQMLDLSGSKVFFDLTSGGPIVLDQKRSDYVGAGFNPKGRKDFLAAARQKAIDKGIDLSDYSNRIVVCVNVPTEYFGGLDGVLCDSTSVRPAVMGQEMTHAYGLITHSRADGSTQDYTDPWDVMSNDAGLEAFHPIPKFKNMGPILNAANMATLGWLDENRVWNASSTNFDTEIQLRPLVRHDLPGFLAARVGQFFVEFRVNKGWDAGIPQPAVLVHRVEDSTSYLMSGTNGRPDLIAGAKFLIGDPGIPDLPFTRIEVVSIDANGDTATFHLAQRFRLSLPSAISPITVAGAEAILGGVTEDGGGLVIFAGKIIRIPPRSPVIKILQKIVELDASASISKAELRSAVRRDAYSEIISHAEFQLTQLRDTFEPAPPVHAEEDRTRHVAQKKQVV